MTNKPGHDTILDADSPPRSSLAKHPLTDNPTNPISRAVAALGGPYLLLSLAILMWSGNFVVGREANVDIPPVALSFWRHLLAAAVILPFAAKGIVREWRTIRPHLGAFLVLSLLLAGGNTLVYFSILETTMINASLINAGVPVAAVFFSWLILRDTINRWQGLGIVSSFVGIVVVVTRADFGVLLGLDYGWGDLYMLLAILCWALYMVLLKRAGVRLAALTLLFVTTTGGALWLAPAYAVELSSGKSLEWSAMTALSLGYVVLLSTIVGWACWNSGILGIGPNRASVFMCLHPVFGSILGMIFFAEALRPYHAVGTALVLSGVWLVARVYRDKIKA